MVTVLALVFSALHLLFLAASLLLLGSLDRRWITAAVLVLLACCAASVERLATGHARAALVLAGLPTAACLLFDAYAFAGGPGRG